MADLEELTVEPPRRDFFRKTLEIGVGFGAILWPPGLTYAQALQTKEIRVKDLIDMLDSLPEKEQEEILSHLERFVVEQTEIGKTSMDITERVKVPVRQVESLEVDMTYDSINNVILYKQISRSKKFSNYLNGEPTLVQRAHETLHHIQDVNSVWDQLETFFKGKQINLERLSETDLERIRGLVQRFYKEPIQPEKIKEALANVAAVYRKVYPVFQLIGEVQAYLSLQPYSKQQLLNKLKHPIYKPMLININPAVFDKIFDATAELAFLRDPIKAAEFVGMYGDFPEIYQREVARLKSERGVSDLGLFIESRRLKLLRDEQRTASAAANYVMQKYQNLRKIR